MRTYGSHCKIYHFQLLHHKSGGKKIRPIRKKNWPVNPSAGPSPLKKKHDKRPFLGAKIFFAKAKNAECRKNHMPGGKYITTKTNNNN